MGLIGEQCAPCVSAAEADGGHGGGLAGRWWRTWAEVRSNQKPPISSDGRLHLRPEISLDT